MLIYVHSNFQIKLVEVEEVELLDRRGYLVISITLSTRGEGKIYLRKTEGIRDWFNSLQVSLIVMNSTLLLIWNFMATNAKTRAQWENLQKVILYMKYTLLCNILELVQKE